MLASDTSAQNGLGRCCPHFCVWNNSHSSPGVTGQGASPSTGDNQCVLMWPRVPRDPQDPSKAGACLRAFWGSDLSFPWTSSPAKPYYIL